MFDIIDWWLLHRFSGNNRNHFAKDCLLTLVKGRLALGSPGCLFVRDHAENGPIHRKMVVDCPLVIISKVKLFFRPDKTRKKEWMVQPVFCIVDAGSCLIIFGLWAISMTIGHWGGTNSIHHFTDFKAKLDPTDCGLRLWSSVICFGS